ncbi:hypothetical protein F5X96DRAFT_658827 [Biscogniauxia mediterranea]|nr:hypothetical protein F5X96DRAFT_658827 [Biscogniauxia mediterranea]
MHYQPPKHHSSQRYTTIMLAKLIILQAILGASLTMASPIMPRKGGSLALAGAEATGGPAKHPALSPLYIAIIVVCSLTAVVSILTCVLKYGCCCIPCFCRKRKQLPEPSVSKTVQAADDNATAIPLIAHPEACHLEEGSLVPVRDGSHLG